MDEYARASNLIYVFYSASVGWDVVSLHKKLKIKSLHILFVKDLYVTKGKFSECSIMLLFALLCHASGFS